MSKHLLAIATALGIMATSSSFAHAKLESSSPAANSRLSEQPTTLTLHFSEPAQLAVLKLAVSGKDVPVILDKNAKAASVISVKLPALMPGDYVVRWAALAADDGHVTRGSFSFSISIAAQKPE